MIDHRALATVQLVLVVFPIFSSCQSPGEGVQRREFLKREALKLRMRMWFFEEDVEVHLKLGAIYHEMGEDEKATQEFQTAIGLDDKHAQAHNHLGMAYLGARRGDLAIKALRVAICLAPN